MILSRLILIFGVIFCIYAAFSEETPQLCDGTNIQYNAIFQNFSISISADLKLSTPNTNVTVTNIQASATNLTNTNSKIIFKKVCAWERGGSLISCNNQFNDSFFFAVADSNVIELQIMMDYDGPQFEENISPPFYSGVVDGNSFSFYDGRIYDDINKCYNYAYLDTSVQFNITECCTSMTPINITNTNQMCTHFTSASNITYNSDNSLYSSMMIDYELKDGNVTMFGKFSGSPGYEPYLIIDDAQSCTDILNNTLYCGYPLFPSGNKLLVFLSEYFNDTQIYGYANRIIIRENQALMAENKPFTQANMCQTFNSVYDSNRNLSISTQSCCKIFQDLASPSSVSATIPTTTSGSKSFSNFNFLTLFLFLIAAFGIFKV